MGSIRDKGVKIAQGIISKISYKHQYWHAHSNDCQNLPKNIIEMIEMTKTWYHCTVKY